MSRLPLTGAGPSSGAVAYSEKVLGIESANLIAYWPLWEAEGATADNYEGTAARDGTYSGVTLGQTGIGDGETCPLWAGNDHVDIYSASLNTAFSGAECTIAWWMKVSAAGVWTDNTYRRLFDVRVDAGNRFFPTKSNTSNRLTYSYSGGGTRKDNNKNSITTTDWIHCAITVSETADQYIPYFNAAVVGTIGTSLGEWTTDPLSSTETVIGAENTTPQQVWDGYIAHFAIWTVALSQTNITKLATV